jgi:hypothetical protein
MGGRLQAMMRAGATQAGAEAGGRGLAGALRVGGRALMNNAIRPTAALLKEFPDVVNTALRERLPVGRIAPWMRKGSEQASRATGQSAGKTMNLLRQAESGGVRYMPEEIAERGLPAIKAEASALPVAQPTLKRLGRMEQQFLGERGGELTTPTAVKAMKQAAQGKAEPIYRAARKGAAIPTVSQSAEAGFNSGIAKGAKQTLERIPGVAESEARTQGLIGATRAIKGSEARRTPFWGGMAATGAGTGVGLASLNPAAGIGAWLAVRGLSSPSVTSRAALGLTHPATQAISQQALRAALLAAMQDEGQ